MEFYTLNIDVDAAGDIPQGKLTHPYFVNHPNSFTNARLRVPISELLVPEEIHLTIKATWTDFLRLSEITSPFLVLSHRFVEVLQTVTLPSIIETFPVRVVKRNKEEEYLIFVANPPMPEYLDFENSPIVLEDARDGSTKTFYIKDVAEFHAGRQAYQEPLYFIVKKPIIRPSVIKHDFFRLGQGIGEPRYFVSARLREALEKANLKGLRFEPVPQ